MKFFSTSQIRDIDRFTIEHEPIRSIDLMERAANGLFNWITKHYSPLTHFVVFAGPGNNGGDGVALARMLKMIGYKVDLFILKTDSAFSPDLAENIKKIENQGIVNIGYISNAQDLPLIGLKTVVIDALFGSGLTRPLSGIAAETVRHINNSKAEVISIDIPSGLFGEENPYPNQNPVIQASKTLTLQFPKLSFFFAENYKFTGRWIVIPIGLHPEAIENTTSDFVFLTKNEIAPLIRKRNPFDHKGTYGHCFIIAGSYGMLGASVLASKACLVAGAGLVTAHIPQIGYSILQQSVPEVMVDVDNHDLYFTGAEIHSKYKSIAIGPGLGIEKKTVTALLNVFKKTRIPLVIDADALNIISLNTKLLEYIPKNSVITPHPGEFDRLFGASDCCFNRFQIATKVAKKLEIIIVLKGAFTQIFTPEGKVFFNSTGNPGMATAGSGDVLTGIIGGLLAQEYEPLHAALVGVYIHGLAGDFAAKEKGEISLIASDIINCLGKAFNYTT